MSKKSIWKEKQKQYKIVGHNFKGKVLSWKYCSGCGLVNLKNKATEDRMRLPCISMED